MLSDEDTGWQIEGRGGRGHAGPSGEGVVGRGQQAWDGGHQLTLALERSLGERNGVRGSCFLTVSIP